MKKRHWMIYAATATLSFGLAASIGCKGEEESKGVDEKGVLEDAGKQADKAIGEAGEEAGDKMEELGGELGGE